MVYIQNCVLRCWLQILVICQLLFKIRAVTIKTVLFIIQNKNSIMLTRHSPFFYSEISGESRATELQAVQPVEDKEPEISIMSPITFHSSKMELRAI